MDYMKWKAKPSYMSQKIFTNDLVTIHKSKATLTLIWVLGEGFYCPC